MTNAVQRRNEAKPTLAQLIEQMKPEIAKVLPGQLKPERMARIATTVIRQTPALAATTPESFLGALLTASQLGLEPGGVKPGCYFVPYGKVCTFIPSWFGLVDLARRSGQVVDVWAEIIYENDKFEYTLGLDRNITRHDPPPLGQDRGNPVGVYAASELVSGGKPFVVMTVAEVEAIRERSRASRNGPWVTDWAAMAKKTAVKQLAKWLPTSAEMSSALTLDGTVRTDVSELVDVKPDYVDGEVVPAPQSKGAAITPDDILADEAPVPAPAESEVPEDAARAEAVRRAKAHLDAGTMPDPAEDIEAAEAYAEKNLTDEEALAYLAGGDGVAEDLASEIAEADPEPEPVVEPEPVAAEPAAEPASEPETPKKSSRRGALDRRMIKLFGAADVAEDNTADQLIVCRFIVGRNDVQTVDELTDVEVGQVCDQLYQWQQAKTIGDKVTDVLNNATLALDSE